MDTSNILGIDLGTTAVKVSLINAITRKLLGTWISETRAAVNNDEVQSANEQNVLNILSAVDVCMSNIPPLLLSKVVGIGICGQMHGLVLWKKSDTKKADESYGHALADQFSSLSHLYTWQDGRCSSEFLSSLPPPRSHLCVATGFGCATIFWLRKHQPNLLEIYECAGTVQDYLVTALSGLDKPVMSAQNAASWGYFDTITNSWNSDIFLEAGFPVRLLPKVTEAGEMAGTLAHQWYGIPDGVPVTAALGDLQCYVLSKLQSDNDAVINVGTSAQFTFIMPKGFSPAELPIDHASPVEYCPYFGGRYLSETASLNGGNALASFVTTLCVWLKELGLSVDEPGIWEKIGRFVGEDMPSILDTNLHLAIEPLVLGERHMPEHRTVTVLNALPSTTSLKNVCQALSWGVIANLRSMSPPGLPDTLQRVVGSGGAITRNAVMRQAVSTLFGLPLVVDKDCGNADSAVGAALACAKYLLEY